MFDGMTGTQTLQVWQRLIYGISVCFVGYTVRKILESFWKYWEFRETLKNGASLRELVELRKTEENYEKPRKSEAVTDTRV